MKKQKIPISIILGLIIILPLIHALEVTINVPEKYQEIEAGEKLIFKIDIKNIEKIGRHDINLEYAIIKDNKTIIKSKETKAIEVQTSFLASINIPNDMEDGTYIIKTIINEKEISEATFYVKKSKKEQIKTYFTLIVSATIIVALIIFYEIKKMKKSTKTLKQESESLKEKIKKENKSAFQNLPTKTGTSAFD